MRYLILLLFVTGLSFGQTKTVTLLKKKAETFILEKQMIIDIDKGDTMVLVFISFIDDRYPSLKQFESIYFNITKDTAIASKFLKDIKVAASEMGKKQKLSWRRPEYRLALYDFNDNLYIENKKGAYAQAKAETVNLISAFMEESLK